MEHKIKKTQEKYLKIVPKQSTWVNVISYFRSLIATLFNLQAIYNITFLYAARKC